MNQVFKSVALRFLRAFVSGAVATMLVVAPINIADWTALSSWLSALALAGIVGGIAGVIMALDKLYRMES